MSKKLKETSHRVWLAGLGALAVAEQEGNDLFQQLVKKGREVGVGRVRFFNPLPEEAAFLRPLSNRDRAAEKPVEQKETQKARAVRALLSKRQDSPFGRFLPEKDEKEQIGVRQARRLAAARRAFLKEFGTLDCSAVNWERLQRERKIFTVTHRGATYVPSFQLDEKGKPRPAVARVIQILGKGTSDWGLALWFTAASGRLDGKRPVDLLSSHPEEVVQAAEQEAAELVF
jgi:hypothetical protein